MTADIAQLVAALVARQQYVAAPPADEAAIVVCEHKIGCRMPDALRDFYLCCNGLKNEAERITFSSLESLGGYLFEEWPFLSEVQPLIFVDANDSNPLCVVSKGPLRGMVAHVFHDGDTCLRFTDVLEMLTAFAGADSVSSAYGSAACRTLPPDPSTPSLEAIYERLLGSDREQEDPEGESLRMCLAMDLCAASAPTRIGKLLEAGDEYVRAKAIRRLQTIETDKARAILRADQRAFEDFTRNLESRIPADRFRRLNLPMLFARRNDDGFDDWIEDIIAR